jgi:ribose 5-phosphate isomerase RpiB
MLTVEDYNNLLALLSRAQYNGIGEAMAAVVLHGKLSALVKSATEAKAATDGNGPNSP